MRLSLGKAVKSKLSKTLHNSMDGIKSKSLAASKISESNLTSPLQTAVVNSDHISPGALVTPANSNSDSMNTATVVSEKGKIRSKLRAFL